MKIAVVSPFHRTGISTITALLGYALVWTQQASTVISYSGYSDMARYLGTSELDDKTRSISQLSKLLSAGAISPENITEYCVPLIRDLHLLDTTSTTVTAEEKSKLLSFVFDRVPTDFIVCEVNSELYEETTKELLNNCDLIVMVFHPYRTQFDEVKRYMQSEDWPSDKPIMYLCNQYDDVVKPLRDISRDMGVKHLNMCKLHYNPWIMKMAEAGKLDEIVPYVLQKDPRVIELANDMREWMSYVQSINGHRVKWED